MSISGAVDYIYKRCHHPHPPNSCEPVILFFFKYIYLAALGLRGHMQDLQLWPVNSSCSMWDLVSWHGSSELEAWSLSH